MGHGVPDIVPKAHLKRGIREVQEAEGKVGKAEVLGSLRALLPGQGMGETLGDSGLLWHPVNAVTQVLLSHGTGQLLCYALRAVALALFIGKALLGHHVLWRTWKCQRFSLLLAFETKSLQLCPLPSVLCSFPAAFQYPLLISFFFSGCS